MALKNSEFVLFANEAEAYVKELKQMNIMAIGSERWSSQRERLEKLSIQAVINVSQDADEFIKTFLVSYNKIVVIIHELLTIDVWKDRVFPLIFQQSIQSTTSFPTYLVLHHEATLISLLEVAMYYQEVTEALDESILDLIDYCNRKIIELVATWDGRNEPNDESSPKTVQQELLEQNKTINYGVQIKCISLVHYISNNLESYPLSVLTRILNTHNFPCLLADLIHISPWTKTNDKGDVMKYEDGKWREIDRENMPKVNKVEGQVWLTLYKLLLSEQSQKKYEYNSYKKERLSRLRGYLNESLLEQISPLADLQMYLQQLSLMEPPPANTGLILEQIPVMLPQILAEGEGRWNDIAREHSKLLLDPDMELLKTQASRWIDNYNLDVMGELIDGPPRCAQCKKEATKRCSRCRNEWYCCRECQVKNWNKHKASCDLLYQSSSHQQPQ